MSERERESEMSLAMRGDITDERREESHHNPDPIRYDPIQLDWIGLDWMWETHLLLKLNTMMGRSSMSLTVLTSLKRSWSSLLPALVFP